MNRFYRYTMGFASIGAWVGLYTGPAGAQKRTTSADTELLLASGEQTVVTASKKAQKLSDAPAAVTVITEEAIHASGAPTLLDLLRSVPGVDVFEPNASAANVSIRGFNQAFANKLLVMVDGRSIYLDFFGGVAWRSEPILLSRIKRIEIVRGPGSALYGANAFNGVINIITKTPEELEERAAKTTFRTLNGEHNSQFNELVTTVGKAGDWAATLGGGYNHTGGLGARQPGQVYDRYSVPIVTLDLEKRIKRGTLLFSAGNSEATADLTQSFEIPDAGWHTSFLSLAYDDRAKNPVKARLFGNFFQVNQQSQQFEGGQTYDLEVQQARSLPGQNYLIYGGSYRHVQEKGFLSGNRIHQEELFAAYLQDDFKLADRTRLIAGLRLDQNSLYGFNFTPRVSLQHRVSKRDTLRASFGTSFRNPTLLDTYYDFTYEIAPMVTQHIVGNRNLKPERVDSYEVGYRSQRKGGYVGLNLFYNQVYNLIDTLPVSFYPSPPFPPDVANVLASGNGRSAHAAGFELETEFRLSRGWLGQFNYSYQDVVDNHGQQVSFSPRHKVNFTARTDSKGPLEAALIAHYVGPSGADPGNIPMRLSPYLRVDARLGYRFGSPARSFTASLVATDLFDSSHLEYPRVLIAGGPVQAVPQRRTVYLMLEGKL